MIGTFSTTVDQSAPAMQFSTDGSYDVAESSTKHRKAPIRQRMGEDHVLTPQKRSRAIGTTREVARNFSVLGWMVRKHLDYVTLFDLQVRTDSKTFNEEIEGRFAEWSRPANCDVAGIHPFPRMLRIAEGRNVLDGDIGLMKLRSLHLQGIESDLVKDPPNMSGRRDSERWCHGVKKNGAGRHIAYAVWKRKGKGYEFDRTVPASNLLMHGNYEYFSQSRGISPITSAINTLSDVKTNFDLALVKSKVSQLIALAFMRGSGEGFGATEDGDSSDGNQRYVVDFGQGPVVLDLDEGDDVKFVEAKTPAVEFQQFTELSIRVALMALDIPVSFANESFTNFFGSRAAWQHYERSCVSKRANVAELLRRITVWLLAEWIIAGKTSLPRGMTLGTLPFEWIPRGMPWWKPGEDIKADIAAIEAGFRTPQDVCRKNGTGDFFDNVDRIKAAIEYANKNGVPLVWAMSKANADAGNAPKGSEFADRLEAIETALSDLREQGVLDD